MAVTYRGIFTLRNNDQELPAQVIISSSPVSSSQVDTLAAVEAKLCSDPVVIGWGDTPLTGCVHPSQMVVSMKAGADGDFRDILQHPGNIYGSLYVKNSSGWRSLWTGQKADSSWEEPFSRLENYQVNVTFSDFGYLSRKDNEVAMFDGYMTVSQLLLSLLRELYPSAVVNIHDSNWTMVNNTDFLQTKVRSAVLLDSAGNRRKTSEVIEDLLSPAGYHIQQYCGVFHLFCPCLYAISEQTYNNEFETLHGTLVAASTDARISTAEHFRHVTLKYAQEDGLNLHGSESLDIADAGYEGAWIGGDDANQPEGYFLISEKLYDPATIEGYRANYIEGSRVEPCIVLGGGVDVHVPQGEWMPQMTPDLNDPDMPVLRLEVPVGGGNSVRFAEYPLPCVKGLELVLPFFIRTISPTSQAFWPPTIYISGEFIPVDGSQHQFLRKTSYSADAPCYWANARTENATPLLRYEPKGDTGDDRFMPQGEWLKMKLHIPPVNKAGKFVFTIPPGTINISTTTPEEQYKLAVYAVKLPELQSLTSISEGMINESNMLEMDFSDSMDGEDFEKEFRMGTPVLGTMATLSNFADSAGVGTVRPGQRLLDWYGEFIYLNYNLVHNNYHRRWKVSGSYRYDHIERFPMFMASDCPPLASLANVQYGFMIRSEEWHVRNGVSRLDMEEFNITEL